MTFGTRFSPRALADLEQVASRERDRIIEKIEVYTHSPDPLQYAKPLKGSYAHFFRFRIGSYRVIFSLNRDLKPSTLLILHIGHRKDVYR